LVKLLSYDDNYCRICGHKTIRIKIHEGYSPKDGQPIYSEGVICGRKALYILPAEWNKCNSYGVA
jgi:hypothetical protein